MSINVVDGESTSKSKYFVISTATWMFLSLVLSLFLVMNVSHFESFGEKFKFVASCMFFCTLFAQIGNVLRVFAHPDGMLVAGGFWDIIWQKLFWKFGPQLIGFFVALWFVVGVQFPANKNGSNIEKPSASSAQVQSDQNYELSKQIGSDNAARHSKNDQQSTVRSQIVNSSQSTNCPKNVNPVVCSNQSLMGLHNKYLATITKANSINSSETGWIVSEFNNEIGKCGSDFTCISGAYINAINSANRVTPESR